VTDPAPRHNDRPDDPATRRAVLKRLAYAPPAVAVLGATANLRLGHSGATKVEVPEVEVPEVEVPKLDLPDLGLL
jgi:hypothetical protein